MRRKIAPTLTWHIQDPFASDHAAFREAIPDMVRELRALLAVARAAERDLATIAGGDWRGVLGDPNVAGTTHDLARALARLDRSSRPQRAGRGRA